ncbi:MAG: signal peptide peptidase SppA [Cellvibrionales bacterium]|nr:signal peptide peptidase SppA [Cellvibrionales bacterium]
MANVTRLIAAFFRRLARFLSMLRSLFLNLLTLFILVVLLGSIGTLLSQRDAVPIPDSGALRVDLEGRLVDQKTYIDPLDIALNPDEIPIEIRVFDLVQAIDLATADERINSMTLILDGLEQTGISKIEEVGRAIMRFRDSGKPVIAIADSYTQSQYLLASYADRILLNPLGWVELAGLASYRTYMADALDKLRVDVRVFRSGPHKDAAETLVANRMSEASRAQSQRLVDDLWQQYREGLLDRRPITAAQLEDYSHRLDQLLTETNLSLAELALQTGLVDALVTREEVMQELQATAGATEEGDFYHHSNALTYLHANRPEADPLLPKVGYLVASGMILDGVQPPGSIGGDSLAGLLKQARLHDDLAALVVRIDSPGGSAFASEVIRQELLQYNRAGIPVVVSMGALAASGGYWIAAPADQIWATPSTLTGSIGAVTLMPTIDRSLDALGLHPDGVTSAPLADAFRLDRPPSPAAGRIMQSEIDRLYRRFLGLVSTARSLPLEQLEPIAGGRVWTGREAQDLGLVDRLGSQFDAIEAAAQLAEIPAEYQIYPVEPPLGLGEQILREIMENAPFSLNLNLPTSLHSLLGLAKTPAADLLLNDPAHKYLHCGDCPLDL